MTMKEVQICFGVLDQRERLIAKLAILAGMRPGEIFGLTWGWMAKNHAEIRQRVYRGLVDTPKTNQSYAPIDVSETERRRAGMGEFPRHAANPRDAHEANRS